MIDFCRLTLMLGNTGAELGFLVAMRDGRILGYHGQVTALRHQKQCGHSDSNQPPVKTGSHRGGAWPDPQDFMEMANKTWCSWEQYNWAP